MFKKIGEVSGIWAVVWTVFFGSLWIAFAMPALGGADEAMHLDYIWQISRGQFPNFYLGPQMPFPRPLFQYQFVANHPPLYYLVQAPLVGFLFQNADDWKMAALVARAVNVALGSCCVFALLFLAKVLKRDRKNYVTWILPAIFCCFSPFLKLSSLVFNDILALVFSCLSIGIILRICFSGIHRRDIALLVLFSVGGMLTRATHVGIIFVALATIGIRFFWVERRSFSESFIRSAKYALLILGAVIATSGAFYWKNYTMSGTWTRQASQDWAIVLGRSHKDLYDVLGDLSLWITPFNALFGKARFSIGTARMGVWDMSFLVSGALLFWSLRTFLKKWRSLSRSHWLAIGVCFSLVLMSYAQQIVHATGFGGINPRYYILTFLIMAIGLAEMFDALQGRRIRFALGTVILWGWAAIFLETQRIADRHKSSEIKVYWNGLPEEFFWILSVGVTIGLLWQLICLFALSQTSESPKRAVPY